MPDGVSQRPKGAIRPKHPRRFAPEARSFRGRPAGAFGRREDFGEDGTSGDRAGGVARGTDAPGKAMAEGSGERPPRRRAPPKQAFNG